MIRVACVEGTRGQCSSSVPHLLWCECSWKRRSRRRTFEAVVECGTDGKAERLFVLKVFLLPVGQDRALVLSLRQKRHNFRALFLRPVDEVGVGPVLERLACVSGQRGFRSGSLHESNKRMRTLKSDAGRNKSIWLLRVRRRTLHVGKFPNNSSRPLAQIRKRLREHTKRE